jgi:acid phosphatase family membrane protein YuiD
MQAGLVNGESSAAAQYGAGLPQAYGMAQGNAQIFAMTCCCGTVWSEIATGLRQRAGQRANLRNDQRLCTVWCGIATGLRQRAGQRANLRNDQLLWYGVERDCHRFAAARRATRKPSQ